MSPSLGHGSYFMPLSKPRGLWDVGSRQLQRLIGGSVNKMLSSRDASSSSVSASKGGGHVDGGGRGSLAGGGGSPTSCDRRRAEEETVLPNICQGTRSIGWLLQLAAHEDRVVRQQVSQKG
jgi:hypothetical protein